MRARLLRIISALSLVLCAAAAAMWVVGTWRIDGLAYNSANHTWQYCCGLGGIYAERYLSGFGEMEVYDAWYTFAITGDDFATFVENRSPPRGAKPLGFAWHFESLPDGGA